MKRLKVAVAILLLIPILLIFMQHYLRRTTDSMRDLVIQADQSVEAGRAEDAGRQVTAFCKKWEKSRMVLALFVKHSELDVVNLSAARLPAYLSHGEDGDFDAEAESLSVQLHHLWESERFSLDNIL